MNIVPTSFERIMPDHLQNFAVSIFRKAGMSEMDATLLSDALVDGDLRGVFSHGTRLIEGYLPLLIDRNLNPAPDPKVIGETDNSINVDGDGGLGYFASFMAIRMCVQKAKKTGMAVGITSNHGHFGSAGHYTRKAIEAGCFGLAMSSHHREFSPEQSILKASGASPICMGVPAGDQPPLIIDMATGGNRADEFFNEIPATYFKMLGLGLMSNALGGILSGMVTREETGVGAWKGVNQGAFFLVVDIARLTDMEVFRRQMDDFITSLRKMKPPPGHEHTETPGGLEHERTLSWREEGIPIGEQHLAVLEKAGKEMDVSLPWD
jgi:L-2-hydroxycarboxylate dehydrogenase (NAD+)